MAAEFNLHVIDGYSARDAFDFLADVTRYGGDNDRLEWRSSRADGTREISGVLKQRVTRAVFADDKETVCWLGDVSWLKASLIGSREQYVPGPFEHLLELVGTPQSPNDFPVLTPQLRDQITAALSLPNQSQYRIADPAAVRSFCDRHLGKRVWLD